MKVLILDITSSMNSFSRCDECQQITLLCEMTIESIGKSFVTFFQRNHALVSKAKLLL